MHVNTKALEGFRRFLKRKHLPLTEQRKRIAEIVFATPSHFSAEELFLRVRGERGGIGKATVYRTLNLMVRSRLVLQHDFGEGYKRYESAVRESHHDHLICERCGAVIEFKMPPIESLQREVTRTHGFRAHTHRLEIYGICRDCA